VSLNRTRTFAVVRKEFREYRRNRFILYTMISGALVFMVIPVITVLRKVPASYPAQAVHAEVGSALFFMLIVPVILPATIAAYSVIGEREQGTLEPVLTTPIRREELLLGKAIATAVPAIVLGYIMFAVLVTVVRLQASAIVVHDVWQPSWFVAELCFVPLLSVWSVWVCTAVSARSSDVRIAQQLGTLASLPALGVTSLMTFRVLQPTVTAAIIIAAALLVIDVGAWRVVSSLFDRERLVLGVKAR
jgi:ABC-type Na+ efflux pump permease subunit